MPEQPIELIIPPTSSENKVAARLSDSLRLEEEPEQLVERDFYDSFDWRLYGQGATLEQVANSHTTTLNWHSKAGDFEQYPATGKAPGFAWDLPPSRLRSRLQGALGVRTLLPQVRLQSRSQPLRVLNKDRKTVCRIFLEMDCSFW